MAFRMEFPRTATHTTAPGDTDETAELYGSDRIVSSPISCTLHMPVVLFGEAYTVAFRTRKQSLVCFWISSRTMAAIADRTSFASANKLMEYLRQVMTG